MTFKGIIGDPCDLPVSLPSKRDILRYINYRRIQLKTSKRLPSNSDVFLDIAPRLVEYYHDKGFLTARKQNIIRLVIDNKLLNHGGAVIKHDNYICYFI